MIVALEPTLHEAAAAHREPFIFHKGEVSPELEKRLVRDYKIFGKPILLSPRGWSGVYPKEAHWLIPKNVGPLWIRRHLAPLVADTDQFQLSNEQVFFHSGDLGDIIAALPAIRALGGGKIQIGHQPGVGNREAMKGARFDALLPLLLAQDYITDVEYSDEQNDSSVNVATFRHDAIRGESLAHWQARHLGVEISTEPWLTVAPVEHHGKVVIARSERYHNQFFPWSSLVHMHRGNVVFVGLDHEHKRFQKTTGAIVPFHRTQDLLELAQLIAGASLFIGNQSLPFWIAAGLGIPLIQETWEHDQNSIIERPNAQYTRTGADARTLIYRLKQ
jgi:hypothetical protein